MGFLSGLKSGPTVDDKEAVDFTRSIFYNILSSEKWDRPFRLAFIATVMATSGLISLHYAIQSDDVETSLENLKYFFLECMVLILLINDYVYRKRLNRCSKYIKKCRMNPKYGMPKEITIMNKACSKAKKDVALYSTIFVINFIIITMLKSIREIIFGRSWKVLPFPWQISANQHGDLTFYAALLCQILMSLFSHCQGAMVMASTAVPTQITGLFDTAILGIKLIKERAARKMEEDNLTFSKSMEACLKESVAHHHEIVQEVLSVMPYLETAFLANITFISLVMACEAFPLVLTECTIEKAIRCAVFLAVQLLSTSLFNEQNEVMSNQNVEVFHALYECDWYNYDTKYQAIILTSLTMSRRPLTVKGRGFLQMASTRATVYSIIVNAFNVLSLLRRMV